MREDCLFTPCESVLWGLRAPHFLIRNPLYWNPPLQLQWFVFLFFIIIIIWLFTKLSQVWEKLSLCNINIYKQWNNKQPISGSLSFLAGRENMKPPGKTDIPDLHKTTVHFLCQEKQFLLWQPWSTSQSLWFSVLWLSFSTQSNEWSRLNLRAAFSSTAVSMTPGSKRDPTIAKDYDQTIYREQWGNSQRHGDYTWGRGKSN